MIAIFKINRKKQRYIVAFFAIIFLLISIRTAIWISSPQGKFMLATGFSIPDTGRVIAEKQACGFMGDGEFYLIVECDPDTIRHWLQSSPFWGDSQWYIGPVPPHIGFHCRFGALESMGYSTLPDGSQEYSGGTPEIRDILSSPRLWYTARNRCPTLPYHQGNLLIVDPESGRIWYSDWKG